MSDLEGGTTIAGYPAIHTGNLNNDTMGNVIIPPTTGTGASNVYAITVPGISAYTDNLALRVKFDIASTGAISINVNGLGAKAVVDYYGQPVTDVRANLIATLVYDTVNGNFQLLGKGGGGNATAAQILIGQTATTNAGKVTGTMPNASGVTIGLSDATAYTASAGLCTGTAYNAYVGAFDILIPTGYHNGTTASRIHIPNLLPSNIKAGVNVGWNGKTIVGTFTSDATANASFMLSGRTAGINGSMVTGTMPDRGNWQMTGGIGSAGSGSSAYLALNNIPEGYYHKDGLAWAPEIRVLYSDLANAIGLTSSKMTLYSTVLGVVGSSRQYVVTPGSTVAGTNQNITQLAGVVHDPSTNNETVYWSSSSYNLIVPGINIRGVVSPDILLGRCVYGSYTYEGISIGNSVLVDRGWGPLVSTGGTWCLCLVLQHYTSESTNMAPSPYFCGFLTVGTDYNAWGYATGMKMPSGATVEWKCIELYDFYSYFL